MSDNTLVTGVAGFIGFHVAQRLLSDGREVVGLDVINNYYDPKLKEARVESLRRHPNFNFVKLDLANRAATKLLFAQHRFREPPLLDLGFEVHRQPAGLDLAAGELARVRRQPRHLQVAEGQAQVGGLGRTPERPRPCGTPDQLRQALGGPNAQAVSAQELSAPEVAA